MNTRPTFSSLSAARQRLVRLMQSVNFGRIEKLQIRGGEPLLDSRLLVYRDVKFCGDNAPRPEASSQNFVLKGEVLDLLKELTELGDGTVECLVVRHGLPFTASIEAGLSRTPETLSGASPEESPRRESQLSPPLRKY